MGRYRPRRTIYRTCATCGGEYLPLDGYGGNAFVVCMDCRPEEGRGVMPVDLYMRRWYAARVSAGLRIWHGYVEDEPVDPSVPAHIWVGLDQYDENIALDPGFKAEPIARTWGKAAPPPVVRGVNWMQEGASVANAAAGKVEYPAWAEWVKKIELLREAGFGWNELSKLHGHSERGFISSAVEHRSILDEKTMQITDELLASREVREILQRKGLLQTEAERENENRERAAAALFVDAIDEIRASHDGSWDQIFEYVPHYSTADSMKQAYYAVRRGAQQSVQQEVVDAVIMVRDALRDGSLSFRETTAKRAEPEQCEFEREGHGVMRRCELPKGHEGDHVVPMAAGPRRVPQSKSEPEPAPAGAPSSWAELQQSIVSLGVEIDDRVDTIVAGLEQMKENAPKMLRDAYDAEIVKIRRVLGDAIEELLKDFEN